LHVLQSPPSKALANAIAESWIGQFKRECLNHFLCFSLAHLDHIVQTFVSYHNEHRPHQGLGNVPPSARGHPPPIADNPEAGGIRCRQWSGELLRHYHRQAA